jgi:hypothetical protein
VDNYWLRTYASLTLFRRADELFLLSHGMRACRIAEAEQLLAIAESNKCACPLLRLACSFLCIKSEIRLAVPARMANANLITFRGMNGHTPVDSRQHSG